MWREGREGRREYGFGLRIGEIVVMSSTDNPEQDIGKDARYPRSFPDHRWRPFAFHLQGEVDRPSTISPFPSPPPVRHHHASQRTAMSVLELLLHGIQVSPPASLRANADTRPQTFLAFITLCCVASLARFQQKWHIGICKSPPFPPLGPSTY